MSGSLLLNAESKLGCAELRLCHVQASHEGAMASTPTGPQATPTGAPASPVEGQATPPAAQGTPACAQATPSRHQENGCMEGSATDTEHFVVEGDEDRKSTAAHVSQETADRDAVDQVGLTLLPTTSDCSLTSGVTVAVGVCMSKLYSLPKDTASSTLITS